MFFLLLSGLIGCFNKEASSDLDVDDYRQPESNNEPESQNEPEAEDSGESMSTEDIDNDGDGWTENEGDCDDTNSGINPSADDSNCNQVDENCDGQVDESFSGDSYEPNDEEAHYLGDLGEEKSFELFGYIFDESDDDNYTFFYQPRFLHEQILENVAMNYFKNLFCL